MCGRFTLGKGREALIKHFDLAEAPELPARFNIAPTQSVAVVRARPASGERELVWQRWGLIPAWAKEAALGARTINARCETLAARPAFRQPFRQQRCLIPADGFYEWKPAGKTKQPFYIRLRGGELMAFAGLWDRWVSPAGEAVDSCTIVTTPANELLAPLHDRMPAILPPEQYAAWLDPGGRDLSRLSALLRPFPPAELEAFPVSTFVNRPENDTPACRAPQPATEPLIIE